MKSPKKLPKKLPKNTLLLAFLLLVLTSVACAPVNQISSRNYASNSYGDAPYYEIFTGYMTNNTGSVPLSQDGPVYSYQDTDIVLGLGFPSQRNSPTGFSLFIENYSDEEIHILWNESSIVLPNGKVSGLIHKGVKFINRNKLQQPTTILAKSRLDEFVEPSNNIYYDTNTLGYGGVWQVTPLFSNDILQAGLSTGLNLRVMKNGVKQDYQFSFVAMQ